MSKVLDILTLYHGIESGKVTVDEASSFMQSDKVRSITKKYSDIAVGPDEYVMGEDEMQEVLQLLKVAYVLYDAGRETGMDDTEYERLRDLLSKYDGEFDSLVTANNMDIIKHHKYPMLRGTLEKVHYLKDSGSVVNANRKSLNSWIDSQEKLFKERSGNGISLRDLEVFVFPKWDGVSVIFEFNEDGAVENCLTRGYTKFNTAKSVSQHFEGFTRPFNGKPYGLKTEVMVKEDDLIPLNEMCGTDYRQTRSAASGILNSENSGEKDSHLVIMQLRYIEEGDQIEKLCPEVFDHPYIKCKLGEIDKIEEFCQSHRFADGLRCDGAVIHIIDPIVQEVLGRDSDKNNFEVAYKFTEEWQISKVKDVYFKVGCFGRITPCVEVKPVTIKGNTIRSASLGSIKRMEYLMLGKGDQVKILYDIIPYAVVDTDCKRAGAAPLLPKMICPSCGKGLIRNGDILSCENPDCDCRKKGRILNYLVRMAIRGISYITIDILYDAGILTSIKDIYKLKKRKDEIISLPGFGPVTYNNWIEEIYSKQNVPDYILFGSIGIPSGGQKTFEKIFEVFTPDDIIDLAERWNAGGFDKTLTIVDGIGDKKSPIILEGIYNNLDLIKYLIDKVGITHAPAEPNSESKFTVCFTKVRDPEIEDKIRSLGGRVVDSVTASTTFCVVPFKGVSSKKTRDAESHGVEIVVIDDLIDEIMSREF